MGRPERSANEEATVKNGMMEANTAMEQEKIREKDSQWNDLLAAYRMACPDMEPGAAFMPAIWARIEDRERAERENTNWFGRFAKALVTAAVAASAILAMLLSSFSYETPNRQATEFLNGTFVEALRADQVAALEPLHVDRITDMEQ